jgi:hypothetical protein
VKAGSARAARRRRVAIELAILALFAIVLIGARPSPARADNIDTLIEQLQSGSDKVRLSAALNLSKAGDPRGIVPLVAALKNDKDKNVRSVSAQGLGSLVTPETKPNLRDAAIKQLTDSEANDPSPLVQARATQALGAINQAGSTGPTPPPSGKVGGVYVNIGLMSSKTGSSANDTKFRAMMVKVATKTLGKLPNMPTTWTGGGVPSANALAQKNILGFYVDGTLNELKVTTSGSDATVSCKVNMLLADFPNKSIFGFLNGGAKVQGSSSPKDIEMASEDCISAVVEDLIAKKIVPTIKTKAGIP